MNYQHDELIQGNIYIAKWIKEVVNILIFMTMDRTIKDTFHVPVRMAYADTADNDLNSWLDHHDIRWMFLELWLIIYRALQTG